MLQEHIAIRNQIECILFVAGDPVPIVELANVLNFPLSDTRALLDEMEEDYRTGNRGIQLFLTKDTVQMTSNREYIGLVETYLQPDRSRSVSRSMLETLAIIAYRQPITRADIEDIRGVRCEYTLTQLQKMELVMVSGRKDTPGRPMLYETTDQFLRKFGLHSLEDLPDFSTFSGMKLDESEITLI